MVEDRKTKVLRVKNTAFYAIESYAKSKGLTMSEAISEIIEEKGSKIQEAGKILGVEAADGPLDFRKELFGMNVQFEKWKEDVNQIMEKLAAWERHGGVVLEYDTKIDNSDEGITLFFRPKKKSQRIQSLEKKVQDIEGVIDEKQKEQIEKEQTIELQFDDGIKKVPLNSKNFEIEIKEPGFFSTTASRVAKLLYKKTDQVFEVDEADDPAEFEKIVKFVDRG